MITRENISHVMIDCKPQTASATSRNNERVEAVRTFLEGHTAVGLQGTEYDMILSDLPSYPEWEDESE